MKGQITLQKIMPGQWEVWRGTERLGLCTLTGSSRDNYPWEWIVAQGIPAKKATGVADTLRSAKDELLESIRAGVD